MCIYVCNEKNGGTKMSAVIWKDDKETEIVYKVKDNQLTDEQMDKAAGGQEEVVIGSKKDEKKEEEVRILC